MRNVVSQLRQAMRNFQVLADAIILIKRHHPMTKQIKKRLPFAFKVKAPG